MGRRRWGFVWDADVPNVPANASPACPPTLPGMLSWAILVAFLFLLVTTWAYAPRNADAYAWVLGSWALAFAAILWFVILIGWVARRSALGSVISEQNVVSLSRLQAVLWTTMIASTVLIAYVWRMGLASPPTVPALDLTVAAPLLTSLGTAAGTTAILARKKRLTVDPQAYDDAAKTLAARDAPAYLAEMSARMPEQSPLFAEHAEALSAVHTRLGDASGAEIRQFAKDVHTHAKLSADLQGLPALLVAAARQELEESPGAVYKNRSPCDARMTDIVQGDEVANTTSVDMGKVQLLLFTLIALFAFAVDFAARLHTATPDLIPGTAVLPPVLVDVVAASQVGYLGYKLPTRTPAKLAL